MFRLQYLDKTEKMDNAFAQYGRLCHSILEAHAKGELEDFELSQEYEQRYDDTVTLPFPPFPKGYGEKAFNEGKAYFDSFIGYGDEYEVASTEEKFTLDIGGNSFVGIADLVLRHKDTKELVVIDHKTKSVKSMQKSIDTFKKQLYIYAGYVMQKFGQFPSMLRFNMIKGGTWINEPFSLEEYNKTMQWVTDTINEIKSCTAWEPHSQSYFCNYICSVYETCSLIRYEERTEE